jgi:hypothetical protein
MWAFNYTGAEQSFVAPTTGVYDITAYGAEGGGIYGGLGAEIGGVVTLSAGASLTILVGGGGADGGGIDGGYGGGGGGWRGNRFNDPALIGIKRYRVGLGGCCEP